MLWIRCGFNADLGPAFYLNADPDPGIQTNADPNLDPGQTLKSHKVEYLHEKYHFCGSGMFIMDPGSEIYPSRMQGQKDSGSRIRICIKRI